MIYAFGSNGNGQVGVGHTNDTSQPCPVQLSSHITSREIKQLASGGNHTLAVGCNQKLEVCGSNEHGQCGISPSDIPSCSVGIPVLAPDREEKASNLLPILLVAATWTASICLTANDRVATFGEGLSGELGLGTDVTSASGPRFIPEFPPEGTKVVHLAASMAHVVAVLSNGEVWGWGNGRKGQLGQPAEDLWSPRKIDGIPFPVAKAVCGKDFTCVVSSPDTGHIAIIGAEGRDRFNLKANTPTSVKGWKDMAASWGSVFILFEDGKLKGFGRDDHGQLPPPGLPPIQAIAAGSEHFLALTVEGKVLAWGWGEHGNCGAPTDDAGDVKGLWNEIPVDGKVRACFAGCATSFVVTEEESG
jgi:protein ATS1